MKKTRITILCILVIIAALGITFYPLISNAVNDRHQSVLQIQYDESVLTMNEQALTKELEKACAYNQALSPILSSKKEIGTLPYEDLLNPEGNGIMAYIEIPKLNLNLPVYHGAGSDILEQGIGHLEGTALPIGGEGCHCVLTGHSGVAGKRLFSDLDQLKKGDLFYLHVLNTTLAYEVTDRYTVLPEETQYLQPVEGKDLCTLITCTPFGVNTHRLLVRGSRIPYEETNIEEIPEEAAPSTWKQQYFRGLYIGAGILAGCLVLLLLCKLTRRRKYREKK